MNNQAENKTSSGLFQFLDKHPSADEFIKGLWRDNPVFIQVIGMCPVLAVSNSAENALAMGLATAFVLLMSNVLVALCRGSIGEDNYAIFLNFSAIYLPRNMIMLLIIMN